MTKTELPLPELYAEDETAWLEAMAGLIAAGATADLDYASLGEYLTDMANRDRKEVRSRLIVLLQHVLKWVHQPTHRSRSWKLSILEHRFELEQAAGRGVLRNHAEAILDAAYRIAVDRAAAETGLPERMFPAECPYTVGELLAFEPNDDVM